MSYFYADGLDRAGNRLITSYKKADQAQRYRAGAKITEAEKFLNISEDGTGTLSSNDAGQGLLVRTLMAKPDAQREEMRGPFVVYAKINGKWEPTSFRYTTYAKANQAVKSALISLYDACAVIETDEVKPARVVEQSEDEEAFV